MSNARKMLKNCYMRRSLRTIACQRCLLEHSSITIVKRSDVSRCISTETEKSVATVEGQVETTEEKSDKPESNIPFVKCFFIGEFYKPMLVYPELDKKSEVDYLHSLAKPVEKFINEVDSAQIDRDRKIPEEIYEQLGNLGLYGLQIPKQYGGLGLDVTGYARLLEAVASDGAISVSLVASQTLGIKGILLFGTEDQRSTYLTRLATGEQKAAFCLSEFNSGSDAASIQARATRSDDGSMFYLTGEKTWVTNGDISDVFTVFAKTEITNEKGETEDRLTAFIVERSFGGVTSGPTEDKLGLRGANICEVHFDNTPVPRENVLGEVGGGFKIAMEIMNSGRNSIGSTAAGVLKKLMKVTAEHALQRSQFRKKLKDFGLIKEKFAKMAVTTYAIESITYLTAMEYDSYQKPDLSLEAAIVKVLSSEGCWHCTSEALQVMGSAGYSSVHPHERYLRDARSLMIFEGTNEILRLYIALEGLKFAAPYMKEYQKKLRNPEKHPDVAWQDTKNMFRIVWSRSRRRTFAMKMKHKLKNEIHPTLVEEANLLEESLENFHFAIQQLVRIYGNSIVERQHQLKCLADVVIDMYAMTACIGRASRSICLGLQHADHERKLAKLFCTAAIERIETNFRNIEVKSSVDLMEEVADHVFDHVGYAASHPLDQTMD